MHDFILNSMDKNVLFMLIGTAQLQGNMHPLRARMSHIVCELHISFTRVLQVCWLLLAAIDKFFG